MKNYRLYELTPSQDVIQLQTKYTLYKRVVNILSVGIGVLGTIGITVVGVQ